MHYPLTNITKPQQTMTAVTKEQLRKHLKTEIWMFTPDMQFETHLFI